MRRVNVVLTDLLSCSSLAIFAANLTFMVRRKDYASLSALAAGFITVGLGEYRNAFVDKVTSYNEGFLIWIPKLEFLFSSSAEEQLFPL